MCGIVGMAGSAYKDEKKVLKDLLYMDQLRGEDSTGLVSVNRQHVVEYHKRAIGAYDFLSLQQTNNLFARENLVMIGHNRWATAGAVNSVNAHPFKHGKIIGVHNGTLVNQKLLPEYNLFEVDSDNIFYSLNKIGVQATCKLLYGAYALVWWDSEASTLNFLRNEERDLWYAFSKLGTKMFWASEKHMLLAALERNKVEWSEVRQVPVDMHLSWKISKGYPNDDLRKTGDKVPVQPYVRQNVYNLAGPNRITDAKKGQTSSASSQGASSKGSTLGAKSVDFYPIEAEGSTVIGIDVDPDSSVTVKVECGTKEAANLMVSCNEESYFHLSHISWIGSATEKYPHGTYNGYSKYCEACDLDELYDSDDEEEEDNDYEMLDMLEEVTDHRNNPITRELFDRRYTACSFCSSTLDYEDEDLLFLSYNEALCGSCANNPETMGMCNLTGVLM